MKNKVKVELEFTEYHSQAGGDIGNLECDGCDKSCQRVGEVWYEIELPYKLMYFCPDCIKRYYKGKVVSL